VLLYCMGRCGYDANKPQYIKSTLGAGSTAAYIVRCSSIPKLLAKKLKFHIDFQWYTDDSINIYIYNDRLFKIVNNHSYNVGSGNNNFDPLYRAIDSVIQQDNITAKESFSYKIFRIPVINTDITADQLLQCLCIVAILVVLYKLFCINRFIDNKRKNSTKN
jgi:hypothetical protein